MARTGGGILFTSLFLGFTSIHLDIIRATGLFIAIVRTRIGARVGSSLAVKMKAKYIWYVLISILLFAGVRLIWVGIWMIV